MVTNSNLRSGSCLVVFMWTTCEINLGMSTALGAPNPPNSNHDKSEKKLSTVRVDMALELYQEFDDN